MLVAISAMHNRHALSRAWAEHTASLGFDMVIVAYSEGDTENAATCDNFNFHSGELPNNPLAGKFNAALNSAWLRGAERVMILPSDDFVSPAWVKAAREEEGDYLFPHTCAIMDSETQAAYKIRKLGLSDGRQVGTLRFGAGRVISRKVIEKLAGTLWPTHLNRGLDTASHNAIIAAGFKPKVVNTGSIPITDIKTDENIWPYQAWVCDGEFINAEEALHMLSPNVRSQIDALKK